MTYPLRKGYPKKGIHLSALAIIYELSIHNEKMKIESLKLEGTLENPLAQFKKAVETSNTIEAF